MPSGSRRRWGRCWSAVRSLSERGTVHGDFFLMWIADVRIATNIHIRYALQMIYGNYADLRSTKMPYSSVGANFMSANPTPSWLDRQPRSHRRRQARRALSVWAAILTGRHICRGGRPQRAVAAGHRVDGSGLPRTSLATFLVAQPTNSTFGDARSGPHGGFEMSLVPRRYRTEGS